MPHCGAYPPEQPLWSLILGNDTDAMEHTFVFSRCVLLRLKLPLQLQSSFNYIISPYLCGNAWS